MTISRCRGRSRLMFLRLCVLAPRMRMYSMFFLRNESPAVALSQRCRRAIYGGNGGAGNLLIYSFPRAISKAGSAGFVRRDLASSERLMSSQAAREYHRATHLRLVGGLQWLQ